MWKWRKMKEFSWTRKICKESSAEERKLEMNNTRDKRREDKETFQGTIFPEIVF